MFVSFVLFVIKFNKKLRFYINYRKLNALIKRNRYFIFLIEKTLIPIISCKYLTKLNIIVAFNKLRMHFKSKDFIILVIFIKVYKYYVLLFELINDFVSYQHYINNVLFEYLYDFCQVYFDNVLIYNKTQKKYTQYVYLVLQKLIDVELQINIRKYQFYVQKINFLDIILSIKDICINSLKIQVIIVWITSICLKKVQVFVSFCNFYKRFIKDSFKIVRSMLKLI